MSESKLFDGYGPYRVGSDGLPIFSDVVADMLELHHEGAERFGMRLGRLTRTNHKPYTKSRIYQMLRDNAFPTDEERRWVIAKLLHIPPFLLGAKTLDDLFLPAEHKSKVPLIQTYQVIPQEFDIEEYCHALRNYWLVNNTDTASGLLGEIYQRICSLEQKTLYSEWKRKENIQSVHLLCEYHMIFAHVARDQEYYDLAMLHLNKAYQLAKNYKLIDTQAAILCRRGEVFNEQGYNCENRLDLNTARRYFDLAKIDFLLAKELGLRSKRDNLYPTLRGRIQVNLGLASSHLASSAYELHQAIVETEKATDFIGKKDDKKDVYFMRLDEERYHLDLATVYLNAPVKIAWYPKDTRRELRNSIFARTNPHAKRRQAFATIVTAKSYLIEKEYEGATKKLLEALGQARAINSKVLIARITSLCNALLTTDYGKRSVDVAELEVTLALSGSVNAFS